MAILEFIFGLGEAVTGLEEPARLLSEEYYVRVVEEPEFASEQLAEATLN